MIVVLGALCTALMSGVIAALATYSMNSNKEHVFIMRQKAEELYLNFELYSLNVSTHFLAHYDFVKGNMSYAHLLQHLLKQRNNERNEDAPKKTSMLISIYFPQIAPDYARFHECRERLNDLIGDAVKVAKSQGGTLQFDRQRFDEFHAATAKLIDATRIFTAAIADQGRKLAQIDALAPPLLRGLRQRINRNLSIPIN